MVASLRDGAEHSRSDISHAIYLNCGGGILAARDLMQKIFVKE